MSFRRPINRGDLACRKHPLVCGADRKQRRRLVTSHRDKPHAVRAQAEPGSLGERQVSHNIAIDLISISLENINTLQRVIAPLIHRGTQTAATARPSLIRVRLDAVPLTSNVPPVRGKINSPRPCTQSRSAPSGSSTLGTGRPADINPISVRLLGLMIAMGARTLGPNDDVGVRHEVAAISISHIDCPRSKPPLVSKPSVTTVA